MGKIISKNKRPHKAPSFVPEHETFHDADTSPRKRFDTCKKNPGHQNFIPLEKFDADHHLPAEYRTKVMGGYIKLLCDFTVKIIVKFTSENRPDTHPISNVPYTDSKFKGSKRCIRTGTGFIMYNAIVVEGKKCPCPLCLVSPEPETSFIQVTVRTASHVVFDHSEAARTVCEMFYDNEKRDNVKLLYGVTNDVEKLYGFNMLSRCSDDVFFISCVTHDMDLVNCLVNRIDSTIKIPPVPLIVSHPHGMSKHITVGSYCNLCSQKPSDLSRIFVLKPGMKCRLSRCPRNSELTKSNMKHFLNCTHSLQPEVKHVLGKEVSVFLPENAEYFFSQRSERGWVTFPEGTLFSYAGGRRSYSLQDVEFYFPRCAGYLYKGGYIPHFMLYDTDTCPGSSGAQLVGNGKFGSAEYLFRIPPNSGSLNEKENVSGVYRSYVFFSRQSSEELII